MKTFRNYFFLYLNIFYRGLKYGHATQILWAKTTAIGCGRTRTSSNSVAIGCNYARAGNIIGKPMYTPGEPCSQCPAGTSCNPKYKGLCGKDVIDHSFKPPFCKFFCFFLFKEIFSN